ncbi:MAG TPA: glycosyltransferase family 1 protein [Gaiellaceae bacterium]|nr:glycosyltransferase family 1 protein [Gaiellaceae bacterium]
MVGLSLLTLVPGQIGGTETYVRGLTRGLAEHGELDYRVFLPPVAAGTGNGLPEEVVPEYRAARTLPQRFAAMALAAARPAPLRRRLAAADLVHYPLTIPLPEDRRPYLVTLQDVLHLDRPELVPRWERALRRVAYDRPVRRAALVIVPSRFSAERIAHHLGVPEARFRVIPHGIDHERLTFEHGPREPFLLYPARPWPHKNHGRLLEAFALLRRERPELRLVLTGGGQAGRPYPEGVEARGLVPGDELVSLYRRASALVFPSLYEGFAFPPLEAMACGCPVAAAASGSVGEIAGDGARLFDATDPEAITAAVDEVLRDPRPWVDRGLRRAAGFSWAAAARGHEAAYRELLP